MAMAGRLIAGTAVAELVAFQDARAFEEAHGAVNRRERDAGVPRARPPVDLLHVGMILGFRQNLGDGPPLACHAHAPLGAEPL